MTERATVRTPMTDAEFLRWNPRWNDQDLAIIKEHLDDAGAAAFEEVDPPGYNLYVEVSHADGNVLMQCVQGDDLPRRRRDSPVHDQRWRSPCQAQAQTPPFV